MLIWFLIFQRHYSQLKEELARLGAPLSLVKVPQAEILRTAEAAQGNELLVDSELLTATALTTLVEESANQNVEEFKEGALDTINEIMFSNVDSDVPLSWKEEEECEDDDEEEEDSELDNLLSHFTI